MLDANAPSIADATEIEDNPLPSLDTTVGGAARVVVGPVRVSVVVVDVVDMARGVGVSRVGVYRVGEHGPIVVQVELVRIPSIPRGEG